MTAVGHDVSVLVACHNAAPFVEDMLASVLAQTVPALEVIVVDDGSTDGSAEIVARYAERGIRLVRQAKQGAASARNRALVESRGRFVIFIDADDVVTPTHLASLRSRLCDTDRCVALGRWSRFHRSIDEIVFPARPTERDLPGVEWLLLDWMEGEPMTQSGMVLIPRVLIDEVGGWNERLSLNDDFEFFTRIIARSSGVRFAPNTGLYYRSGLTGSLSGRRSDDAVRSAFDAIMLGTSALLAVDDSASARRGCADLLQHFDYMYYPQHRALRRRIRARVAELGGASCAPKGPPGFQRLRRIAGWKVARRIQHFAERHGLNGTARAGRGEIHP